MKGIHSYFLDGNKVRTQLKVLKIFSIVVHILVLQLLCLPLSCMTNLGWWSLGLRVEYGACLQLTKLLLKFPKMSYVVYLQSYK